MARRTSNVDKYVYVRPYFVAGHWRRKPNPVDPFQRMIADLLRRRFNLHCTTS